MWLLVLEVFKRCVFFFSDCVAPVFFKIHMISKLVKNCSDEMADDSFEFLNESNIILDIHMNV